MQTDEQDDNHVRTQSSSLFANAATTPTLTRRSASFSSLSSASSSHLDLRDEPSTDNNKEHEDHHETPVPLTMATPSPPPRSQMTPPSSTKASGIPRLPSHSRLLQPTASRVGAISTPRSQPLTSRSTPTPLPRDGQSLAQERVRQHKLRQEQRVQQEQAREADRRPLKWTAQEGHARARARVMIRSHVQPPTPTRTSPASNNQENVHQNHSKCSKLVHPPRPKSSKPVTVPQAPRLSTSRSASRPKPLGSSTRSQSTGTSSAASSSSSQRPGRRTTGMGSTQWYPTVPQAPKFVLDRKYGEKPTIASAYDPDVMPTTTTATKTSTPTRHATPSRIPSSNNSVTRRASSWKPTIPQGPRLSLNRKYRDKQQQQPQSRHRRSTSSSPRNVVG